LLGEDPLIEGSRDREVYFPNILPLIPLPTTNPFHKRWDMILMVQPNRDALDFLNLTRYCCRRMIKAHVDIFGKILRCDLKEPRELREAGFAWWEDYDEIAEKADRFEALVTRRKEEARLQKGIRR
jgi:DNA-directed RNA polymerase subunit N (RpoN/RPB10)